jgi:TolA-binding protein
MTQADAGISKLRGDFDRKEGSGMRNTRITLVMVVVAAVFALTGCTEKKETTTAKDVAQEAKETAGAAKKYTEEQRTEYMAAVERRLDQYNEDIQALRMKAENMSGEARQAAENQIKTLQEKRDAANQRLQEMKSASSDAWMDMKDGMDKAMGDLSDAYKRAAGQY